MLFLYGKLYCNMKKKFNFSYDYFASYGELNPDQKKTIDAAIKAQNSAYAPYSNFKVGAALLLNDNTLIHGSNQENKAFPSGLCAERVALFSYGAQKHKPGIKILGVVGSGEMLESNEHFSPCGSCRQVMVEFAIQQEEAFQIILRNFNGSFNIFDGIHQLLPFTFGGK